MALFTETFESELAAPAERTWAWAISVAGILAELRPLARMTFPPDAKTLLDLDVQLGTPLTRSWLLLFGVLPVDRIDLTLVELDAGRRFLEQSPMLSMRSWRHERTIEPLPVGCRLTDRLVFEPRMGGPLARILVRTLFERRHRVLRRELGTP